MLFCLFIKLLICKDILTLLSKMFLLETRTHIVCDESAHDVDAVLVLAKQYAIVHAAALMNLTIIVNWTETGKQ